MKTYEQLRAEAESAVELIAAENRAGVPARFHEPRLLKDFDRRHNAEAIDVCRRLAIEWLMDWDDAVPCAYCGGQKYSRDRGLLFTGPVGTGKSAMASATARELLPILTQEVVTPYKWMSTARLVRSVSDSWGKRGKGAELLEEAQSCVLLVLDDLGGEVAAEWSARVVFELLDARYADEYPTFVTSNLTTPREFTQRYGERISSRLFDMCVPVELKGPDMRQARGAST